MNSPPNPEELKIFGPRIISSSDPEWLQLLTMPRYEDYKDMPVEPLDEPLVPILPTKHLIANQIGEDMQSITGEHVYVREGVLRRLGHAAMLLSEIDDSLRLEVRYGYRALKVQTALFAAAKERLSDKFSGDKLLAEAHRQIADPRVAGHPTGGAVDIQIITKDGQPLNFGSKIWTFSPHSFARLYTVGEEAFKNKLLLRKVMMAAGFAPFDGEWWHFSYGDKEWAYYYGKPAALYDQVDFRVGNH